MSFTVGRFRVKNLTPLGGLLLVVTCGLLALGFFYLPVPYGFFVGVPAILILFLLWFGGAFIPPD